MDIEWTILPRGDVAPHWSGLYVTMNKLGSLVISRITHERLGEPAGYLVMFDRFNRRLGLRPAKPGERYAYPARKYGKRGSKIIHQAARHNRVSGPENRSRRNAYFGLARDPHLAKGAFAMPGL